MAVYRDVVALEGPGHRTLTSHTRGEDGQWYPFMTVHYRRKP